jgi:serine protease
MKKYIYLIFLITLTISCKKENDNLKDVDLINQEIKQIISRSKALFDWNEQSTDFIFKALQTCEDRCITIGYTTDFRSSNEMLKELIIKEAEKNEGLNRNTILVEENDKLATLKIRITNQKTIESIRHLGGVDFVEVTNFVYDREFFIPNEALQNANTSDHKYLQRSNNVNPGDFDPNTSTISYDQFMGSINGRDAEVMRKHNLTYVYDSLKKFDGLEVAVLDNGIFPDYVPFAQVGNPTYKAEGYFSPGLSGIPIPDGPHPRNYDLLGLSQLISGLYDHGTRQTSIVYGIIPKGKFRTVRSAQWVFFIFLNDFNATRKAIIAMADDPDVKIISMSMGTVFIKHEMKRAIQYFTSKDKIFVSASGTFLEVPVLKDLVGVVFPANMPETIATTGIQDTRRTNGVFVLGETSTSGPQNDFVVDHSTSSSETVSATAAMFSLIWSINPNLTATQIKDIFIRSSTYYNTNGGQKHPIFGWGKVDCKAAAKTTLETL